jgi:hypothetical protein
MLNLTIAPTNPRFKLTIKVEDYEKKASMGKALNKKRQGHF